MQQDEKAVTAAPPRYRAVAWSTERGHTIERVLLDNVAASSRTYGMTPVRTSAPGTSGHLRVAAHQRAVERHRRALSDGWPHKKFNALDDGDFAALVLTSGQ